MSAEKGAWTKVYAKSGGCTMIFVDDESGSVVECSFLVPHGFAEIVMNAPIGEGLKLPSLYLDARECHITNTKENR